MTSLNDDVTLKFRSERESAREWKKREDKKGYCAYENKKKTNYTFITIISMITIIIAIIYCQSLAYVILLILFVHDLVHSLPPYYIYIYITLLPYRDYDCHRCRYYGDWLYYCTYIMRDSETIYKFVHNFETHIRSGKLYKKKRRDRLEHLKVRRS